MKKGVFDVIKTDDRFTILSDILEQTGIGDAMSGEFKAFTFFAPTDEAFREPSEDTLRILASPQGDQLISEILGRHIVPKSYFYADDLRRRDSLKPCAAAD